jgi:hypothetical protein
LGNILGDFFIPSSGRPVPFLLVNNIRFVDLLKFTRTLICGSEWEAISIKNEKYLITFFSDVYQKSHFIFEVGRFVGAFSNLYSTLSRQAHLVSTAV